LSQDNKDAKYMTRDFGPLLDRKLQELVRRKQEEPLESMFHKAKRNSIDLEQLARKFDRLGLILDWNPAIHPEVETPLPANFPADTSRILAMATPTDKLNLRGAATNLETIRENQYSIPIVQHDLVIDPYQIYHSRYYGAHYVSLFPGTIPDSDLLTLFLLCRQHGMAPIIHVSNTKELEKAMNTPAKFVCLSETDFFGTSLSMEEIRDLVEEIPQERMVICRLDNWSTDKLEAIWDAEINFCWLTYPESSRNLNRLLSTLDELS